MKLDIMETRYHETRLHLRFCDRNPCYPGNAPSNAQRLLKSIPSMQKSERLSFYRHSQLPMIYFLFAISGFLLYAFSHFSRSSLSFLSFLALSSAFFFSSFCFCSCAFLLLQVLHPSVKRCGYLEEQPGTLQYVWCSEQ